MALQKGAASQSSIYVQNLCSSIPQACKSPRFSRSMPSKLSVCVHYLRSITPQVCKSLRFSGVTVPRGYEAAFQRALWTFRHQRVYCASARALVPLRPLPAAGLASCAQVRRRAA